MNPNKSIKKIKNKILPVLTHYGVRKAGFFGSLVRGEMRKDSDVDILVEIDKNLSLLDVVRIKLAIEEVLKKKVDLVEYDTIKPALKDIILKEEVRIL